jgi:hypothetical protein
MTVIRGTLIAAGTLTMAYAVAGALASPDTDPAGILVFLVAVLVVHDAVWMPAVLAVLAVLARRPASRRPASRRSGP